MKLKLWLNLLVLFTLLVTGCSSTGVKSTSGLVQRLKNRGPVSLSSDNPFLAANLLISREMQKSPEVAGFIEHRGAPTAIEVNEGLFSPLTLFFYYSENREYFALEEAGDVWIIKGPQEIDAETFLELRRVNSLNRGEPRLEYNYATPKVEHTPPELTTHEKLAALDTASDEAAIQPYSDPFQQKLERYERARQARQPGGAFSSPSGGAFTTTRPATRTLSLDSIITEFGTAQAELTPKGDLVHYVTYQGETLSMISRWYTHDRDNAGRLARINRLGNPNALSLGDIIIIPSYLLRNKKRLNNSAVQALTKLAGREVVSYP